MKRVRAICLAMTGLIACRAIAAPVAEAPQVLRAGFHAKVTVDANGHATFDEIGGINGSVESAVRSQLAVLKFAPAHVGGVAVAASTYMSGGVILTPVDGERYSIALEDLILAPAFAAESPRCAPGMMRYERSVAAATDSFPRRCGEGLPYPVEMARAGKSGWVELKLRIEKDGRATFLETIGASDVDFEKAVREKITALRFSPQIVAGQPIAVDANLPVWFHGNGSEAKPIFQCGWEEKRPRLEGNAGCLGMIQVVAVKRRI